jgi:hypothetical protein
MKASSRVRWIVVVTLFAAASGAIAFGLTQTSIPEASTPAVASSLGSIDAHQITVTSVGEQYIVNPNSIVPSGADKDEIPSIDNPLFVSADDADAWLSPGDRVLALVYQGEIRVYPIRILVWHEIVNDVVAGDPVLVTYCPLSDCAAAYVRTLDGASVEFGTSGKLYNSNLVMYDRQTQSNWSQMDGLAIVGEASGQQLEPVSVDIVSWGAWEAAHPDSMVLSRNTGFDRDYDENPYSFYYSKGVPCFPVMAQDSCVSAQTDVYGIEVNGAYAAYCEGEIAERGMIDDRV